MMNIATNSIDSIDALNTRDLKMAIGEEVKELEVEEPVESEESEIPLDIEAPLAEVEEVSQKDENEGVESLKKLLKALTNEDVAASMKGMKISINITLGDN